LQPVYNEAAPDTPMFVLHLYDREWRNRAALRAVGYTKKTPDPPGAFIERDRNGHPTGLLVSKPNSLILYSTLAKGPKLSLEDQVNFSRLFFRELNWLGVTGVIDARGGFQNYPDDYAVVEGLAKRDELTLWIAYNLFTQRPKQELEDFANWVEARAPGPRQRPLPHCRNSSPSHQDGDIGRLSTRPANRCRVHQGQPAFAERRYDCVRRRSSSRMLVMSLR
jgi:predicted amidohydrolase YtcJ